MTLYIDGQPNSVLISPVKALVGGVSYNVTFPAASMTVAGINNAQSFSAIQTFNANVILGNGVGIATTALDGATLILQARNTAAQTQTVLTVVGAATIANSYITAQVGGTWTKIGTWTLPAFTMGGDLSLGSNALRLCAGLDLVSGMDITVANTDSSTAQVRARDNGVGVVNIARFVSAVDPYFEATLGCVFPEMTAPAAIANKAFLFAQDNGAGKTQLMVLMPTGAAIQLAIEA